MTHAPPGLIRNWTFEPSTPGAKTVIWRLWRTTMHRQPPPAWQALTPFTPADRWIGYFIFAPDGALSDHHRFTLARLKQHDARLAVICATPSIEQLPAELAQLADALYWKEIAGFDFSAYAILVSETALHASGAELVVMNDSVLGPFGDLHEVFERVPEDFAGLTGYSMLENHIQSFAWRIRNVDRSVADAMAKVAGDNICFHSFDEVRNCQETRFARIMARQRDAGALWFSDHRAGGGDLPLVWPLGLIEEGFPFLKRSLFTKFSDLADHDALNCFLEQAGHPLP